MPPAHETRLLERERFDELLQALVGRGYRLVGPTVRDGAILYDELESAADLPEGWTDEQEGGTYRLRPREDKGLFGYAVGPRSWKEFLWPPRVRLWRARAEGDGFEVEPEPSAPSRDAYIGVRSCDLHAIASLDSALRDIPNPDPGYVARRANVFIVALNCWQAGGTCFCVSMGTGPRATSSYDVALTEVLEEGRHYFLVEPGSDAGAEVVAELAARDAEEPELAAGERAVEQAVAGQGRTMDTTDLRDLLYRNYEHPRWDDVADRCLTCGNCTMVCPTCFCTSVEDVTDLTGDQRRAGARVGLLLHDGLLLRARGQHPLDSALALPAVDDPQARDLGRPVRHVRVRRMRPLHHLVPGRDRHHRGGGRDPGDRQRGSGGVAGGRAMKAMDALIAEVPALAGLRPEQTRADRGLCDERAGGGRGVPVSRGPAGRRVLCDPPWVGGARAARARA